MIENGERRRDTSRVYGAVVTILAVIAVIALVNPIFSQNKRVGAQLQVERMVEQDETNCAWTCQFMGAAKHDECMNYCSTAPRGADLCKLCVNYCTQKRERGFVAARTKCQYLCIESGICDGKTLKTRGPKAAQSDIVSGTLTDASEFPYIVSIKQRSTGKHFCCGTLISARSVLTAAHCCEPLNANDIEVVLGDTHLMLPDAGQQTSRVDEKIMHPNYDPQTQKHNDVCVLTMTDNANVDDPEANIDFAVLGRQGATAPKPGTEVVVVGWGASKHGSWWIPPTLQKATMKIMSDEKCRQKIESGVAFFSSFMCAHSPGSTQDTCDGDSGGPILFKGVQIGITSFGFECGREPSALPSVYQEMAYFRSWIDEQKTGPRAGGGGCVSTDSLVNVMMKKNVGHSVLMKKRVGEVAIGDYVETANGFEMVWLIMPYGVESEIEMEMIEMTVELGDGNVESIVLTREHLMFDGATGQMKRADEFAIGDQVQIFVDGKRSAGVLVELSTVVKTGTSLVTTSGQFVLSNGICVSSYSHSPLYAQVVHALSLPFRWMSLVGQPAVGKLVLEMLHIPDVVRPGTAFSSMFA